MASSLSGLARSRKVLRPRRASTCNGRPNGSAARTALAALRHSNHDEAEIASALSDAFGPAVASRSVVEIPTSDLRQGRLTGPDNKETE
ncbi:hypothetical protein [Polyangium aurulentum]|uniref:hypothetical protein n=1 Tax=Polyangium aurulentum TaxID=2567896 RepID=UPI0010ADFC46|nr:hypothetical protein [Polyangium aurulentum]UQA62568.1 hypothetical protein E8A73_019780 [Polyangium aurulentum]